MATTTPNYGWVVPTSTDLVKNGATAIETLGDSIDASLVGLRGGTTGQVLSKTTGTQMAFTWVDPTTGDITGVTAGTGISGGGTSGTVTVTNSMATAIDAKGDLIAGTGADAFARVAVGTNGQVLQADSTAATGVSWLTPSAGALTKIGTTTFTGTNTVNVNSVFTSAYKNYKVMIDITSVSTVPDIRMFMRASGTDSTTGLYQERMLMYAGAMAVDETNNIAYWFVGVFDSTYQGTGATSLEIFTPQVASPTKMSGLVFGIGGSATRFFAPVGGYANNSTQYDGFTLKTSGGTMDGSVTVYGYSN